MKGKENKREEINENNREEEIKEGSEKGEKEEENGWHFA